MEIYQALHTQNYFVWIFLHLKCFCNVISLTREKLEKNIGEKS